MGILKTQKTCSQNDLLAKRLKALKWFCRQIVLPLN